MIFFRRILSLSSPVASALDNFRSPLALFRFYGVCLTGVALDLGSKHVAEVNLGDTGERVKFIPGYLHFEWVLNRGAVFGIAPGQRWLFVSVSIIALGFLTWLFAASRRQPVYQFILGLLLAGVLGNLYDRITFGYVRDMIHALPGWHWPAGVFGGGEVFPYVFNVADMFLCTGVGLMLVHALFVEWIFKDKQLPSPAESPA